MGYIHTVEIKTAVAIAWQAWMSRDALERWLAPKANVLFREGGAWEFFWDQDPKKDSTLGCKILKIEPERLLRFEWQGKSDFLEMFLPPKGRPTKIDVRFEKAGKGTRVTLTQEETRSDLQWKAYDAWMSKAWAIALSELKRYCEGAGVAPQK